MYLTVFQQFLKKFYQNLTRPINCQVPYGWKAGVLFNLLVLAPSYIILYRAHETPQFLLTRGKTLEAFIVAKKCGMTDKVKLLTRL